MEIYVVQSCDEHGRNRAVDRLIKEKTKIMEWIKEYYPFYKNWFFSDFSNYEEYEKTRNVMPERGIFFVHGMDYRDRVRVHFVIEKRRVLD